MLDPVGDFFGMDGAILLAFILGIPANEIILPILLMIYSSGGAILTDSGVGELSDILSAYGWSGCTAVCTAVFALFHWPCSTSLITVYKETKSLKATALAFAVPTALGLIICLFISIIWRVLV